MHLDVRAARSLARQYLTPVRDCWAHAQAVAGHAEEIAGVVGPLDRDLLICAAWLHDLGLAPQLYRTGVHALDGAIFLQERQWPDRLVALVAHHGEARLLVAHGPLRQSLSQFERELSPVSDALTYADLASGPAGERISVRRRLDGMELAGDASQTRGAGARRQLLLEAAQRTEQRLHGLRRVHA